MLLRRLLAAAPDGKHTAAVTEKGNIPVLTVLRRAGAELEHVETGVAYLTLPSR